MLNFKLFENVQQAKKFLKDNNIPETDKLYLDIRELLKGHDGYVGWFVKVGYDFLFKTNELNPNSINSPTIINGTLQHLKTIKTLIVDNPNIIKLMDKPVIEYETTEKFTDAFEQAKLKYKAKKIYDEFPPEQKKFININNNSDISLLSNLYDDETKEIFIKKNISISF